MKLPRPVLLASLATAFSLLGDQALYAILPTYFTALDLLPIQVGLLLSVNRWVRLLTNQLAARVCRHHNAGLLLVLSLGLGASLTFVYALVHSFVLLLAARMLWGLCWSFIRQIGLMTVVGSAAAGGIGRTMGLYNGISRLGSISGNLLGALGHDVFGYTAVLVLFGLVSLAAVPLGAGVRPAVPAAVRAAAKDGGAARAAGLGLLVCGAAAGGVDMGMVMSTLGLVLAQQVGTGLPGPGFAVGVATLTGALLAGRWVAEMTAPLLGGFSDRLGRRFAALGFLELGGLLLAAAALSSGVLLLAAMVLLFFLCATGANVALVAEAGVRGDRCVAAYVTAVDLGAACGPVLGWTIQQLGLPPTWILWLGSAVYLVSGLVAAVSLRDQNRYACPPSPRTLP